MQSGAVRCVVPWGSSASVQARRANVVVYACDTVVGAVALRLLCTDTGAYLTAIAVFQLRMVYYKADLKHSERVSVFHPALKACFVCFSETST